jgi:hypothetical protein
MQELLFLQVRTPKDDETTAESATQIFASLLPNYLGMFKRIYTKARTVSFELVLLNNTIYYYVVAEPSHETFITSLMLSSYQKAKIIKTSDPLETFYKSKHIEAGEVLLSNSYYLPIKTFKEFASVDPLAPLIGFFARQEQAINMAVQLIVTPANFAWQDSALYTADHYTKDATTGNYAPHPQKSLIAQKAGFQGGKAVIRLLAASDTVTPYPYLQNLAGTFGSYSLGEGNQLTFKKSRFNKAKLLNRIKERKITYFERNDQVFNAQELATIWHPPGVPLAGIKNISWGKTLAGEPPQNIPVAQNMTDEEKQHVNFFATTEYKNQDTIFGIKDTDRRRHVYVMGKTGAGKSTLIANMAIDDIRKGRGIGVIDPHGDLAETIIDYIPKRRLNDVVYLEPFDAERPFSLNVLEIKNKQHKDLIASGIVSIFSKIYADSWGPRLEYILRNTIFSLLEIPNTTLIDALRILSDASYRNRVVPLITDPVIRNFWEQEFAKMTDKLRVEAISPIQNKVGQFVSSKMIRNIIGEPKSTINLEDIMNEGKILILNLSQGKLGEDNAALLGAMIITQIQLAAMNRAFMKEEDRRDFFLYVDEFQNFATSSFIKILSEARKYRLAITLANQYIDQLDVTIQKAIFGNAGTLISFVTGAGDAALLQQEYAGLYTQNDLVSLGKHEIVVKLSIDNMMSNPFPAKTLPLPTLVNENREKIIRLSKEKYGRKPTELTPIIVDAAPAQPDFRTRGDRPRNSERSDRPRQDTQILDSQGNPAQKNEVSSRPQNDRQKEEKPQEAPREAAEKKAETPKGSQEKPKHHSSDRRDHNGNNQRPQNSQNRGGGNKPRPNPRPTPSK